VAVRTKEAHGMTKRDLPTNADGFKSLPFFAGYWRPMSLALLMFTRSDSRTITAFWPRILVRWP
jgi:hypothetical protein